MGRQQSFARQRRTVRDGMAGDYDDWRLGKLHAERDDFVRRGEGGAGVIVHVGALPARPGGALALDPAADPRSEVPPNRQRKR